MSVMMYSAKAEGRTKELELFLKELVSPGRLDVFRSVEGLAERLREPWQEKPIVLIWVHDQDELLDLVSMREELRDIRLILVVPDAGKDTLSLAHRLWPSYLSFADDDNHEKMRAVLQKMLSTGERAEGR
jgi:hypothetical protein